jgi:hypothetical protein
MLSFGLADAVALALVRSLFDHSNTDGIGLDHAKALF